nr:phosphatase PAP2 family protein [Nocardioidaceae bacterium]
LRDVTVPNAVLWLLAQTGGRATILVVVGLLTVYIMRERRVWQPLLRVLVAFALLTVVVYALKIGLGRTAPGYGASVLYVEGRSYPSGHSANAVLWWGLAVWLVRSYDQPAWVVRLFTAVAVAAPVLTSVSMLALNYHWLTDVVAGLALGIVLLRVLHLIFSTRLGQWGSAGRAGGRSRDRVLSAGSSPGG